MPRPSKRQGALLSVGLIIGAAIVGSWSYRTLLDLSQHPPVTSPTSTSSSTSALIPPNIDALVLYIDGNFSESPWYGSIVGYEQLTTDGVVVLTSLPREAVEPAVAICRAVSFWRPGDDLRVVVRDAGGRPIVETARGGGAERCLVAPA